MISSASKQGSLRRALANVSWLLAGKGVGAILSLVYLGLAVRVLKSEGFGEFTLVFGTAQAIAAIVSFQTWQIVVRYGVHHVLTEEEGPLARLVGFCIGLDLAGAIAGCFIAWGGVTLLKPLLGWSNSLSHAALAFCFVMLLSIRSTAVGLLRLRDRFGLGAMADAVTPIMRFLGALAAVLWDRTVTGFLLAWAIADIVTSIVYWVCAIKVMPRSFVVADLRKSWSAASENPGIWRFAWLTNLNSAVGTGCNNMIVLLIGIATGAADAGHYRLAYQLSQALVRVSEMFARAVLPEFARSHAGQDLDSIKRLLRRSTGLAIGATLVIVLSLFAFGRFTLQLVAGRDFMGAFPLLLVLGIAASLDLIGVNFEPALVATGHAGRAFQVRCVRTLALFGMLALLMPHFGTMGVAFGILVSSLFGLVLLAITAWRAVTRAGNAPVTEIV
ncbi:lipopolysaccharide biosynthesis protein [Gluconacetobacter azotocaptans]|uniref:lipopolysaccharide biosynthesis protein n=1 Tax=Gluconacetobacter azotocaptans TaxID=142834 RepID=UPI0023DC8769|nr:oligosaccharide flippase family protein [Gluconacetobacter azotocaptans]